MDLGSIKIKRFADGEIYVQVQVRHLQALAVRRCYQGCRLQSVGTSLQSFLMAVVSLAGGVLPLQN